MQVEVEESLSILDEEGHPLNFGWARMPYFIYNPELIHISRRRLSESDRYIICSTTHILILEVFDDGYLGYIGVVVLSLKDKKWTAQTYTVPFPMGSFEMPVSSEIGTVRMQQRHSLIDFISMKDGIRIIKTDIPQFGHHRRLRGELVLFPPEGAQSLFTLMPWRGEKNAFRYSRRSPWFITEGVMQFGTTDLIFTRGNAWGIFDWNRVARPRADMQYWAAACGISDGRQAGFSVGYGSVDSSQGTENAFFVNGRLHKLDQVTFHISPSNWLLPWRFTSNDNRLEMDFTPSQERVEHHRLGFYSIRRRQVCGMFSGKVLLDDGAEFTFQNLAGFAERRKTRF
ncbi:MAG: DUF2804 domain-containing protein [Treponema sp.]|jgi:hypothetical protein|nr:DUF2804 domain-containing protein [Treponema sp.]